MRSAIGHSAMTRPRPIQIARRQNQITGMVLGVTTAAAAWWSLRPLQTTAVTSINLSIPVIAQEATQPDELDMSAFEAAIWNVPSAVALLQGDPESRIELQPPEIVLKLVAITTRPAPGGITRQAAIYNTKKNVLRMFEEGEIAAGWRVESILAQEVLLRTSTGVTRLKLRKEPPPIKLGSALP